MTAPRDPDYLTGVVRELRNLPHETEWVEFKHDNSDPQLIGEYISALANSAALNGKIHAYILWGIDDETHDIVGTTFSPSEAKRGNEPLETWLLRLLAPKIDFRFHELTIDGKAVVLLEIERAYRHPVRFQGAEYIRVGEVKKPLKDTPDRERDLWRVFDSTPFEDMVAAERVSSEAVLQQLDYPKYFELLGQPLPETREGVLDALASDRLIVPCEAGDWNISNAGALLLAKSLRAFPMLARKAIRVIQYQGESRVATIREREGTMGYACGFEGLITVVNGLLPSNEVIEQALRRTVPMYPELAVRELVANALIHQDLFVRGAGPTIEIFSDRVEITNPGQPLVDVERFVDSPPRSRNEALASLMRRFGICEERGSGIDKVGFQVEFYQLPAPLFEAPEGFTRATLFSHKDLTAMEASERIRACYLHACLRYVTRKQMSNATIRERFGIEPQNAARASKLLKEALEAGAIVLRDPGVGNKGRRYLPYWAVASTK